MATIILRSIFITAGALAVSILPTQPAAAATLDLNPTNFGFQVAGFGSGDQGRLNTGKDSPFTNMSYTLFDLTALAGETVTGERCLSMRELD